MLPIGDENPHPPGFKPKLTYALIAINVIIFLFEVAVTGQFFDFSNRQAMNLFLNWGAVPGCITGEISGINTGVDIINCPAIPELTLLSSIFMHGGLLHLGGNMLFLWIFGDNIEAKKQSLDE
jgi:membrane associated rhomboid family serine protease